MAVDTKHAEYTKNRPKIDIVRDCVEGAQAIKLRTGGGMGSGSELWGMKGTRYLPPPNPADTSQENKERYYSYLERANFVNFTGFTLEGMVGMVFRKPPVFTLPQSIDYLLENADGNGLSLEQVSQSIVSELLQAGRDGLLVDYPQTEEGLTKQQVADRMVRATIKSYKAESIINWRTITVGSVTMISMVVLCEPTEVVTGFETKVLDYHRVLFLENGIYKQQLYDENGDMLGDELVPTNNEGSTWKEIPFVFVGSEENDVNVDKIPLYDIAEINVAHYRNSADYEESSYQVGQPTPVIWGLSQSWVNANMKKGVMMGSRRAILLPEGGGADLLQANPNQMPERGMEQKEQQMVNIGARIIQDTGRANENVDATNMRNAGQNSKLSLIVSNTKDALTKCLQWSMEYMGSDGEIVLEFNTQFYDKTIDPQTIMAGIQLLDRGVYAKTDLRANLRKANMIADDRTDEMLNAESEDVNPII